MQVFVKNPFGASQPKTVGLYESFWSADAYIVTEDFDFSQSLVAEGELSPFLAIDMRVSLLVSLLRPGESLGCYGLGAMGVLACYFQTRAAIRHDLAARAFEEVLEEYLPREHQELIKSPKTPLDQVLLLGEEHLREAQANLKVNGKLIIGQLSGAVSFSPHPDDYEAFGSLWPEGEATEFGWRFKEETLGLEGLEFAKFVKRR